MLQNNRAYSPKKTIIAIILVLMFIFGLIMTNGYGVYYDYITEHNIVLQNVYEYAYRVLPEGSSIYNRILSEDDPYDGEKIRISESEEKDHGVAIMYPIILVDLMTTDSKMQSTFWYYYVYIIFFCGVVALFYVCRELFNSDIYGIIGALSYFLSPRIFADGHYNNKDIMLLSLSIIFFALTLLVLKNNINGNKSKIPNIIASIVGGLIINLKIIGIPIVILFLFNLFICLLINKIEVKISLFVVAILCAFSFLFAYFFTPATWGGIDELIDYFVYLYRNAVSFSRWNYNVLFNGNLYISPENPLPRIYLPVMILITTPIVIDILFIAGIIILIMNSIRFINNGLTVEYLSVWTLLLYCTIPIAFAAINNSNVYNGWRHFFFAYFGIIVISVYAVKCLADMIRSSKARICLFSIISASIIFCAIGIVANYPYENCYYNLLIGNDKDDYELDYWGVGVLSVLEEIKNNHDGEFPIKIAVSDVQTRNTMNITTVTKKLNKDIIILLNDYDDADYYISNSTYSRIYPENPDNLKNFTFMYDKKSYGKVIYEIYRSN